MVAMRGGCAARRRRDAVGDVLASAVRAAEGGAARGPLVRSSCGFKL